MACLLVLGGGHRGDVIRNMTVVEFASAEGRNDVWVARVFKHKTGSVGPAYLTFSDHFFTCMKAFFKQARPDFVQMADPPADDNDGALPFFLSEQGAPLDRIVRGTEWFRRSLLVFMQKLWTR